MLALAKALVDWNALGKIILAGLIGGVGVVIVFGLGVYGVERFEAAKSAGAKAVNAVLVGAAGVFCIGAVVIGIVAMTHPSHGAAKKPEKKAGVSVQRAE